MTSDRIQFGHFMLKFMNAKFMYVFPANALPGEKQQNTLEKTESKCNSHFGQMKSK